MNVSKSDLLHILLSSISYLPQGKTWTLNKSCHQIGSLEKSLAPRANLDSCYLVLILWLKSVCQIKDHSSWNIHSTMEWWHLSSEQMLHAQMSPWQLASWLKYVSSVYMPNSKYVVHLHLIYFGKGCCCCCCCLSELDWTVRMGL